MSSWLNDFKLAIASSDLEKIEELLNFEPKFQNLNELKIAQTLIKQASELIQIKTQELKLEFEKLNKAMKYQV